MTDRTTLALAACAGISDTDKGVLIQMEDGSEFQLIIKQTAKYDPAYYERPDTPIH